METASSCRDTECHFAGGEAELVQEVERYRLDTDGLSFTHSLCSGTQLLDLHFSAVARSEQQRAGVDPQLSCNVLEFSLVNERVPSLKLWVGKVSICDFNPCAEWVCRVPGLLAIPGRGAG